MEQEMPDYETIRAAVVSEKWALEKVLACYGDEINRLAMVKKRQPDGSVKEEMPHIFLLGEYVGNCTAAPCVGVCGIVV